MPANIQFDEIRDLARRYQYDRYVAALLLPRHHREALITLAAFGGELQRIPDLVSEPMMAAIRFHWWRDELTRAERDEHRRGEVRGGVRTGHLLCDEIVKMASAHALPFGLFQGMIDAAETELDATPLKDAAEVRQVMVKFQGAMFELAGRILRADVPREVWNTAAVAYGAATWAGEFDWRSRTGAQTYVASDMIRHSADQSESGAQSLVEMASEALDEARGFYPTLDRAAQGALLPLSTVPPFLRAVAMSLQHSDGNGVDLSTFARAKAMLWCHWRRRI